MAGFFGLRAETGRRGGVAVVMVTDGTSMFNEVGVGMVSSVMVTSGTVGCSIDVVSVDRSVNTSVSSSVW